MIKKKLSYLWRNYNLSIVLIFLFFASWAIQFIVQYIKVSNDHPELANVWNEFWPEFLTSTFENWQSEFLQLLTFVILTSFLIHKNSAESKDSSDRLEKKIDKILQRLDETK